MPYAPKRPCNTPGCANLSHAAYCHVHAKRDARPSAARRGYGGVWPVVRAMVLREQPWCACGAQATEVDHIIAIRDGGTHALHNLRPMCHSCHVRKTHAEKRERGRRVAS